MIILLAFVVAALLSLLNGFIVMLSWNAVVPTIFHLQAITFWQAWILTALVNCLVGRGVRADARK